MSAIIHVLGDIGEIILFNIHPNASYKQIDDFPLGGDLLQRRVQSR